MSTPKSSMPIRPDILDEAAAWLVEFRADEASAAARREFDTWLRTSPEHVRAYLALLPTWENGARLDRNKLPDPNTLLEWMRSGSDNIIPLEGIPSKREIRPIGSRMRLPLALAASLVTVALGTWLYINRGTYSTNVGEQRSITLADGSIVELNALSQVRVRFGERQRDIDLVEGQALFRVAHEKSRPFIVHSGETRIRAIGTQFDVYRKRGGTTVTVLEGRVVVIQSSQSDPEPTGTAGPVVDEHGDPPGRTNAGASQVYLSAGEQVNMIPAKAARSTRANIPAATAWMQRRLIFSATPLSEVAEEFNRYNTRQLLIEDPSLESMRINGIFSSTDPAALLSFLREQEGISVAETDREIRLSRN